ncbi:3-ketoacyl-(acyl-carrier-protein) reductase (plasmid) [Rhizobium favelukesii]|uniref:3-ketoacyl-(Acyl-carrier-protein) reductase n=1 Tax=Rhizobium favelukesii TaxID=348824 RepID=W6RK10_9HYPH|nr:MULTISPECIES: SDR family NAD(P)-dependent oxidoreductase [Rhizobium]CDM60655.1 3-ketoacyl-(acyl-carrier-protein) reductase [Rhizobium favelukesii]
MTNHWKTWLEHSDNRVGKVVPVYGDFFSEVDMDRAITAIRSDFGRLDAVVANAGINGVWAPIDDLTPDEWDATIRVNLRGTYLTLNRTVASPTQPWFSGGRCPMETVTILIADDEASVLLVSARARIGHRHSAERRA